MKVTARCLAAFAPLLTAADLTSPVERLGAGPFVPPDTPLHSLVRFEGALAWEGGDPRSAVPALAPLWAQDAWLAGWDHADARFYRADGPGE